MTHKIKKLVCSFAKVLLPILQVKAARAIVLRKLAQDSKNPDAHPRYGQWYKLAVQSLDELIVRESERADHIEEKANKITAALGILLLMDAALSKLLTGAAPVWWLSAIAWVGFVVSIAYLALGASMSIFAGSATFGRKGYGPDWNVEIDAEAKTSPKSCRVLVLIDYEVKNLLRSNNVWGALLCVKNALFAFMVGILFAVAGNISNAYAGHKADHATQAGSLVPQGALSQHTRLESGPSQAHAIARTPENNHIPAVLERAVSAVGQWFRTKFDDSDSLLALFTGILAVATIGLWIATWRLVRQSKKTSAMQLRAYVSIAPLRIHSIDPLSIELTSRNHGQTPAHNECLEYSGIRVWEYPLPEDWPLPKEELTSVSRQTLYNDAPSNFRITYDRALTNAEVRRVTDIGAGTRLYVFGCRKYRDAFGKEHITTFCRSIRPNDALKKALQGEMVESGLEFEYADQHNYST